MKNLLITYDLVGVDETSNDYKRLIEHIKSHSKWGKVSKSVWVVRTHLSAEEVRNNLNAFTDGNDRVFVARLSGEAAWRNIICKNDWLMETLTTTA